MKYNRTMPAGVLAVVLLLAAVFYAPAASAQAQGLTKKTLMQTSVSGDNAKESVIVSAEFAKDGTTGRHTHPGDEYAVVLKGTLELLMDGSEPRRVGAGEAYHNPGGVIHEARNAGDGPVRVIVTFIVEKGEAVTQQVE